MKPTKRRVVLVAIVLVVVVGGAAAYTTLFTASMGGYHETGGNISVTANTATNFNGENPAISGTSLHLNGVYFNSSATTHVAVDQYLGTRTKLSSIDATNGTIWINPEDKAAISVEGNITGVEWEDPALDGTAQLNYSASGTGTIVVTGLKSSTDYAAATTGGTVLTTGTTTASGEATIDATSSTNTAIVLLQPSNATVSNPSPNGTDTNNENVDISFDVSDSDFGTDAGDELSVELVVDGSTVNSWNTITSNQTLSHTVNGLTDGQHSWHVNTSDQYGSNSTSQTHSFTVNHYAPDTDNSSATPRGGTSFNDENIEASINISDRDFAEPSGDDVKVDFYVDGTKTASKNITANQTVTFTASNLSDGQHSWHVEAVDEYGLTKTSSTFNFEVNHYAPTIYSTTAAPTGKLSQSKQTFSINLSDRDFSETSGDTVTAELYLDGNKVGADTLTSNGTASVSHTISTGGDHSYYWQATDEYGQTTTSSTYAISAPAELEIYNESAPTKLVTNATVELRFYANETGTATIVEKSSTNGVINLTGLPVDEPVIAVARADNYTSRRIFIESIFQQSKLYLLPVEAQLTNTMFVLEDYVGQYPSEDSALKVQRSLNGSYQTVVGDLFGATGRFPAQLEYNHRHRLVLVNVETGDRRMLGTYTPIVDTTRTIAVTPEGEDPVDGEPPTINLKPATRQLPAEDNARLNVSASGGSATLDSWAVTATLENQTSSQQVWYHDEQGPGSASTTLDLRNQSDKTINVSITYSVDNTWVTKKYTIQVVKNYRPETTLMGGIASLVGLTPESARDGFTTFLAMLITIFSIAGLASVQPSGELAGLVGVFVLTGFAVLGWVGYGLVFVSGIGLVSMAAIRRGL